MGSGLAGSHVPVGRPPVHGAASAGMSMAAEVRPPPGVPSREPNQCSLLYFSPGTIPHVPRDVIGGDKSRREVPVHSKQINPQPESVMADVYLGVTVAGLYTLVGMGLIIAFM